MKNEREAHTGMLKLMTDLQEGRIDKVSAVSLAGKLVKRLGGEDGIAEMWAEQVRRAIQDSPGRKTTLDALKQIKDLIVSVDPVMNGVNELANMSDAQVEDFTLNLLLERVGRDESVLKTLASRFGYRLVDDREVNGTIANVPAPPTPDPPPPPVLLDAASCSC
jgi:hypothetical protein